MIYCWDVMVVWSADQRGGGSTGEMQWVERVGLVKGGSQEGYGELAWHVWIVMMFSQIL